MKPRLTLATFKSGRTVLAGLIVKVDELGMWVKHVGAEIARLDHFSGHYRPQPGDYYTVDEAGMCATCPKEIFEANYKPHEIDMCSGASSPSGGVSHV